MIYFSPAKPTILLDVVVVVVVVFAFLNQALTP
jgi:hypothetical protein